MEQEALISHENHEHDWDLMIPVIEQLKKDGLEGVIRTAPSPDKAFILESRCLTCGDEGVVGGIHAPGSGILLDSSDMEELVSKAGIQELTTHDNCGAFGLAYPNSTNPNTDVRQWGEQQARKLGIPHRHIPAAEMQRPRTFHNAVMVYYDAVGGFNRLPNMPAGFVVSRAYADKTALSDLALYLKIAFGHHGFGQKFSSEHPFHVGIIGHPEDQNRSLHFLESEIAETVQTYGDRVHVTGVEAKKEWVKTN